MSKIRVGAVVLGAVLALAAIGFAQSPPTGGQPAVPGQSARPAVPDQPNQPAVPDRPPQPAVPGQQNPNPAPGAEGPAAGQSPANAIASQMAQVLNLSDGQTVKLQGVLQNEYEQLVALREDASMSREDKQAKLTVIRQNAAGQVMSILTPEQQKRLVQLLNEQDDEQAAPPQPGTQPPPVRH